MNTLLFWLYLTNAVLLINHEIDSAYWKEWELFHLPGGISGFLLMHFPLVAIVLYGLVLVAQQAFAGLIISLVLSLVGIGAFGIHSYFIKKGHPEFRNWVSVLILILIFVISLVQGGVTICLF